MSESDSAPPATTTSARPSMIWSAALTMAWAPEAQARLSGVGGDGLGKLREEADFAGEVRAPGRRG